MDGGSAKITRPRRGFAFWLVLSYLFLAAMAAAGMLFYNMQNVAGSVPNYLELLVAPDDVIDPALRLYLWWILTLNVLQLFALFCLFAFAWKCRRAFPAFFLMYLLGMTVSLFIDAILQQYLFQEVSAVTQIIGIAFLQFLYTDKRARGVFVT